MKSTLLAGVALCTLAAPACAMQEPVPSRLDPRIGEYTYVEKDVFHLLSAPEATAMIKLNDGETVDSVTGANVCPQVKEGAAVTTDCALVATPRFQFLHLKFLKCMVPQMVLMTTKTAAGKMRWYNFQVDTEPVICPAATAASPAPKNDGFRMVSTANAAEVSPGTSDLKQLAGDALTAHPQKSHPIFYAVSFRYPGDDADKRRESARERREREKKEQIDYLLTREVDDLTQDPWRGNGNVDYRWRGDSSILPYIVRDNGRSTGMKFSVQHRPLLYQVTAPDGYQCRDEDAAPSEERQAQSAARGDALIITGTSRVWRLRTDDGKVADICNLNYSPYLPASPTGTISDSVQRVVK